MEYKFSKRKKPVDILVGVAALPVVRRGRLRRDITSVAHCTQIAQTQLLSLVLFLSAQTSVLNLPIGLFKNH
jgi:hypothetical protein